MDEALQALQGLAQTARKESVAAPGRAPLPESGILEKTGRAFLFSDVAAILLAFMTGGLGAWALNIFVFRDNFQKLLAAETAEQFVIFMGLGLVGLFWLDSKEHYRQRLPFWESVGHIIKLAFFGFVVGGFIQFAFKSLYSRLWLGISWTSLVFYIFALRSLVRHHLRKKGQWFIPALIIGDGEAARAAAKVLKKERHLGYDIVRELPASVMKELTQARGWLKLKLATGAHHVFLALDGSDLEKYRDAVRTMVRDRVSYSVIPPWIGLPSSTMSQHHFPMQDVILLHNSSRLMQPVPRFIKRSFDVVASGLGLLLLAPLMAIMILRVRQDGGPAFFAQERVGRNGKTFACYKFRSMRVDAEAALAVHLRDNPAAAAEWREYQKLKNDPRITPFGAFIRRTSLDELPQLFNVLKGDMSLVGPRPIMQGQEEFYGDDFGYYDAVRPGITGPWQVSGRNALTFKERVALESWYVRNWTMGTDLVILLKTIPVLLKKDQAF